MIQRQHEEGDIAHNGEADTNMRHNFAPMNEEYASIIVNTWKYDGDYSIYDYSNEAEHILDSELWGIGLFAVLSEDEELVGELTIEFYDSDGNEIENYDSDDETMRNAEIWIGFGLKPELTGRGLGAGFVSACIEFAVKRHDYKGKYIRLGVATFNKRAIKVYERVGFEPFGKAAGPIDGEETEVIWMKKRL